MRLWLPAAALSPVTYDKLSIKEGSLLGNVYVLAVSKHLISSIHKSINTLFSKIFIVHYLHPPEEHEKK
jgi:hypothetical protein